MLSPKIYRVGFYTVGAIVIAALLTVVAARSGQRWARMVVDKATGGKGSPNMPIGVGGGAMSIHGAGPAGVTTLQSGGSGPCLVLVPIWFNPGLTEIELDGVTTTPIPTPNAPGTTTSMLVTRPWKMDMYARSRNGAPSATQGLHVESTDACIQNNNGIAHHGIAVVPFGNMSSVYPYGDLTSVLLDEDGLIRRRYEIDDSRHENIPLKCTDKPDATGDEDVCEHMSTITIQEGTKQPKRYNCTSGECSIGIEE
jgi:hypothetical protein